ncbi:hypothetical protein CYFUS_001728 [Cystobacter fuscus]|uniref:Immunity MXAN-0049 protein domain-containing protein n=1 Tax=Cystobacter fuscus TaxID=43 RepID=A0A250IX69_9BACT|nr:DUF1629 domain-containing protein [Cystobacter fuscus]ATB36314.1 hypothetical protein CYFUS_001728 [Cystobacter fuscus]
MTMRYFKLNAPPSIHGQWRLADPVNAQGQAFQDPFMFTRGNPVSVGGPLKVPLAAPGRPTAYSVAGISEVPIVHERLAQLLTRLAPHDVQLLPVDVEGQSEPHRILVATKTVQCIDDARCAEVLYRTPDDGSPTQDRQYKLIRDLRIDPAKVVRTQLFRPRGWTVVLLVSETLREELMFSGLSGLEFDEVTGPKEEELPAENP